jgi:broad specificity phosphatase PhoE
VVARWRSREAAQRREYCRVAAENRDTAAVVVSHYFVTLVIILKALGLPVNCFTKFRLDLGGVSILEFRDTGTRLLTFNDTSY